MQNRISYSMYETTNITNNLDIAMLIFVTLNWKPVDDKIKVYTDVQRIMLFLLGNLLPRHWAC